MRRAARAVAAAVIVVGCAVAGAAVAQAEPVPGPGVGDPAGLFTEVTITSLQSGAALNGYGAPDAFDPLDGYPAGVPAGSTPEPVSFAGTIGITDPVTGQSSLAYCIDLFTDTTTGVHYELGDWDAANVPNLGYVAYVLENYYPTVPTAPAAASDAQRAAAVQAAIWFFSDRYVLDLADPLRATTAAIVADALANGPAGEPAPPQLEVTPTTLPAPDTGELVGPFAVTGDGPATLRSVGVEVFADAAGELPLPDGSTVQPGSTLWARSTTSATPQGFVLERSLTVLRSSVYLYDGSNSGRTGAQKLVLAQSADLTRRAGALLSPYPAGGLDVTKHVLGDGAGRQGPVTIEIACTAVGAVPAQTYTLTIDSGSPAGDYVRSVTGIPAGSECTITETSAGDNELVDLAAPPVVTPAAVTVAAGSDQPVDVTNTYTRALGALQVAKTITGPAAGLQGVVTLTVTCDEPGFDVSYTVDAGAVAGSYAFAAIDAIPAGSTCRVTETGSGANAAATLVSTTIDAPSTTVAAGPARVVTVTNTYDRPAAPFPAPDPDDPSGEVEAAGTGPTSLVLAASGVELGEALALAAAAVTAGAALLFLLRRVARR